MNIICSTYKIELTRDQFALVSEEDYAELSQYSWYANQTKNGLYAARRTPRPEYKIVYMHSQLMGGRTDHIDGNPLNNQRDNLRLASQRYNMCNKKIHREGKLPGVTWQNNGYGNWYYVARIQTAGKKSKFLGSFHDKFEAYNAYVNAFLEAEGDYYL